MYEILNLLSDLQIILRINEVHAFSHSSCSEKVIS